MKTNGKPQKGVPILLKTKFYFHLHSIKSILTGKCERLFKQNAVLTKKKFF